MCAYLLAKERSEKDFARQAGAWGEDPHCYPPHVTYWLNGGPKGPRLIEDESQADEFIQTSLDFFTVCIPWLEYNEEDRPVCRLTSKDFQEIIQRIASMYGAVARHASDDVFIEISAPVAKQYVQAVLNVVRRETSFKFYLKSGVIKEPGQTVIDSCVGWFRLDSVIDAALEEENGLVGTICKLALDQKRPPSPVFMKTCMMICENVAKMTRGLASFQLAMERGVLLVGVQGVCHANATVVKHGEPLTLCKVLREGTKEREIADQVAAQPGLAAAAREEVTCLLNMVAVCDLGFTLKDSNQWVGEECYPLPRNRSCAHCHAMGATQRCSRCNETYYCNGECQKKHWKEHKPLCPYIPQLRQPDLKGLRRLVTGHLAKYQDRLKQNLLNRIQKVQEEEGVEDVYACCRRLLLFVDLVASADGVLAVDHVTEREEGGGSQEEEKLPQCLVEIEARYPGDLEDLSAAIQDTAKKLQPKQVMVLVRMPGP
eukprot:CAMPEP_0177734102 /NCGR_PEP_ID=MMETSP0484_2-20121128/24044_1 /TAXON_ID=354590 /ORGANISM="Rhodomonas lens, Strain RHODO" /LENGTH=485 /DNA_ID=CAMNT_0019247537 /DNA_START=181 /DNA_END=1635 /DNA_ORIENTATION=+